MRNKEKNTGKLLELNNSELAKYNGGNVGNLIGLGIAQALLAGYFGPAGMTYAWYKYLKD